MFRNVALSHLRKDVVKVKCNGGVRRDLKGSEVLSATEYNVV